MSEDTCVRCDGTGKNSGGRRCGRCGGDGREVPPVEGRQKRASKADVYQAAVDRLRAENERLREAIEAHRSRVLFEAKTEFCAHRADELLWAALGGSQAKGSE